MASSSKDMKKALTEDGRKNEGWMALNLEEPKSKGNKKKGPQLCKIGMGRLIPEAWPTLKDFLFVYGLLFFSMGFRNDCETYGSVRV